MAPEAMLEKSAVKVGKVERKPEESLFFVTRETTVESNRRALDLLANVARQFQKDPMIRKSAVIPGEIESIVAQAKKDPAILTKMVSSVGVEQIA